MVIRFLKIHKELISYIFWGAITTAVNFITYFICTKLFHWNYLFSNLIAWILAVLFAFFANKILVFQDADWHKRKVFPAFGKFLGARIFSFLFESFTLWLGISILAISDGIVKILAGITVIVLNYLFSKIFIFRRKES